MRLDRLALSRRVRAALAQPEPQGPTDEELIELALNTKLIGSIAVAAACHPDKVDPRDACAPAHTTTLDFARAVLTRWGRPAIKPDGPAVPHGREPASVTHQPTDKELHRLMHSFVLGGESPEDFSFDHCGFARAALARWGRPAIEPMPQQEVN